MRVGSRFMDIGNSGAVVATRRPGVARDNIGEKTRENAVFSCCGEAMNFFASNRNPGKLYLRRAALFFSPDNDFRVAPSTASDLPTGDLWPPSDP